MRKIIAILLTLSASFAQSQAGSSISLSISQQPFGRVLVAWPTTPPNFRLEERTSFSAGSTWSPSALVPAERNGRYEVLVSPILGSQYFRLNQVLTDDVPDPEYRDTNGDGIDGDVAKAVFVASPPLGNDANPGTMDRPVASIEKGIELGVRFSPSKNVYVSKGIYTSAAAIRLASGVSIYGEYDAANHWQRAAANETIIRGASTAFRALFLDRETHVEGLHIISAAAALPGESSYAIQGQNLIGKLVVRYNVIEASAGAPGTAGAAGTSGLPGGVGNNGDSGDSGGDPGVGGTSPCGQPGGRGGLGGYNTPGLWGTPGAGWDGNAGSPSAPGRGGAMGPPCDDAQPGVSGMDGRNGNPGLNGLATSDYGSIVEGEFRPGQGNSGTSGTDGDGGGGAGGGGANHYVLFGCGAYVGGGGGGGGGGGCAGTAGSGGSGGGGSFGLFLVNSAATVAQNRIITGNGGRGGAGGSGGLGGSGGAGGPNGEGWRYAAPGGNGGKGGNGGSGGSGSGGAGGPSVGIVLKASPGASLDGNTMFLGLPGSGGKGGSNGSSGSAPDGPSGVIRDVMEL